MSVLELNGETAGRIGGEAVDYRSGAGLDVDLLRTLVAIADTGSFNRAARQVYRTPSAVSMQMKKLEEQVGRPLFVKDGRSVALTPDGEALVGYGRRIVKLTQEALQRFRAPGIAGTIRFGTPDDYAGRFLPEILSRFAASHPMVEVDVVCQSSLDLVQMITANQIDIALVSAGEGATAGQIVHREPLVWAGLRHGCAHEQQPIPLALSHLGCCWRRMALEALDRAGIAYRVAYTSRHYLGQLAALMAGLAIAPLPHSTVRGDIKAIGDEAGLPSIGQLGIELRRAPAATGPLFDALANHIEENFYGYSAVAA
ncbi:LysR substrate-binding domain-containing protein [Faunimonas sp. B44]|uniref:LysR substrate-binding domain-containing protein n=1 Tax=Faunimonas sp. B44 TaxID=3461493 RepID=UPI004043BC43